MLNALRKVGGLVSRFGYDAVDTKNRRRPATGRLLSEERELPEQHRRLLVSGTRDLARNFAIARWAIGKHLDFVSTFSFHAQTDDRGMNEEIEAFIEEASEPANFDSAGRHGRDRYIRLLEARACVDGDVFSMKMADGTSQAIEGDRVRNPLGRYEDESATQGVKTDKRGRALEYAVHQRTPWQGFIFERWVPSVDVFHHAYYDRFDQVRGVSPIASALNSYRDVYENFEYALAKMKVAQLFGIKFTRDGEDSTGEVSENEAAEGDESAPTGYRVDLGRGPFQLDLDPGDDAEFLENKTPSTEFSSFSQVMIGVSLKSLDLPFSFYDEAYTNFFGSRAALNLYLMSAANKRKPLRGILRAWALWRLTQAIARRKLVIPRTMSLADIKFEWIPAGVPWWNPKDEINADLDSVDGCLRTRSEIRKERYGDDWYEVMVRRSDEDKHLAALKITPTRSGQTVPPPEQANDPRNEKPGAKTNE